MSSSISTVFLAISVLNMYSIKKLSLEILIPIFAIHDVVIERRKNILSLKYQNFTPASCEDRGIRMCGKNSVPVFKPTTQIVFKKRS